MSQQLTICGEAVTVTEFKHCFQVFGEGPLRPIIAEELTADLALDAWIDAYRQQYEESEAMTYESIVRQESVR